MLLCLDPEVVGSVERWAEEAGLTLVPIGAAGGDRLVVDGLIDLSLDDVTASWRDTLPRRLGASVS